ncbi:MAG: pro-sigmaK processing inhibitor BofA family protein [Christensenellaceae bacterium]|jgi:inhibitor of the pro-sigma K processing machinery|nr:pro-sigmaK processing inhibitor BofA family protein [Christensenellaceae bacterium]
MLSIEWDVVVFFIVGILILYGVGWLLLVPLRRVLWFLFNSIAGILSLLLLGSLGSGIGIVAVANPFSAVMTGFLGLPGLVLVLLIQNLL